MKAKLLTLILGVPSVAAGVRWAAEPHAAKWSLFAAIGLFLAGQYIVRFEDYPAGQELFSRFAKREE